MPIPKPRKDENEKGGVVNTAHVCPSGGDDSNAGTHDAPLATLDEAMSRLADCDDGPTVYVWKRPADA